MTSRELVLATLEHRNTTGRAPRCLWTLPWAGHHYPDELAGIMRDFPTDMTGPTVSYRETAPVTGDSCEIGEFVDEWGCHFVNLQRGIVGEVKSPIIPAEDEEWDNADKVHIPVEWLTFDKDEVNRFCAQTDLFVSAAANPNPFERLQYIRGTENLYMDLMDPPPKMLAFFAKLHAFYCELLTKWAETDVDALSFMDDWGSQNNLLINPELWVKYFKPMYKDFIDIAHSHGKKIFMHSDGNTLAIYPHLIELGLDALNSQLFCMGVDKLEQFKGKITFWGEIDRQHLLPHGTVADITAAVNTVHSTLWQNGGCIAQCEFGPGARPENVREVFRAWDAATQR